MPKAIVIVLCLFLALIPVVAQDGQAVSLSQGPPYVGYQKILVYSGTNLTYLCTARSNTTPGGVAARITVTGATNASPVSFTATAHGLDYQSGATTTPVVLISGATSGWTGINGVWTATPTSANAFTIAVDTSAFGAFSGQSITVQTVAPRTTDTVWSIQKFVYDGSSNLIWTGWAASPLGATGLVNDLIASTPSFSFACASRTTYSYQ